MGAESEQLRVVVPQNPVSTHTNFRGVLHPAGAQVAMESTASYRFDPTATTNKFVVFALTDISIRDSILSACDSPLWELWYDFDPMKSGSFPDFVEKLLSTISVTYDFIDEDNTRTTVDWTPANFTEVSFSDFVRYKNAIGSDYNNPEIVKKIRVFECALGDGQSIAAFSWRNVAEFEFTKSGYASYLVPIASHVDTLEFDVTAMASPTRRFQIMPHVGNDLPLSGWLSADQIEPVIINDWVLPGQGATVAWMEFDESD